MLKRMPCGYINGHGRIGPWIRRWGHGRIAPTPWIRHWTYPLGPPIRPRLMALYKCALIDWLIGNSGNASSDCELVKCDLLIHMGIFNDQPIQSIDYSIHRLNWVSQRVYFNVYAHIPTAVKSSTCKLYISYANYTLYNSIINKSMPLADYMEYNLLLSEY